MDDDAGLGLGDGPQEGFRGGAAVGDADADLARASIVTGKQIGRAHV